MCEFYKTLYLSRPMCVTPPGEDVEVIVSSSAGILVMGRDGDGARQVLAGDIIDVDVDAVLELLYYINNTDKQVRPQQILGSLAPIKIADCFLRKKSLTVFSEKNR